MKILKILGLVLLLLVLIFVIRKLSNTTGKKGMIGSLLKKQISNVTQPTPTKSTTSPSGTLSQTVTSVKTANSANPFGVMLGSVGKVPVALNLGAVYYRPVSIFVDKWNGSCTECDTAVQAGLKLVLTIRNGGGASSGSPSPSHFPSDLESYKKIVGEIVDTYHPVVLVVENEENSMALFYDGTPDQYNQELKAACDVAHSKNVKCANGGIVSSLAALLTANSYKMAGNEKKADDYVQKTLRPEQFSQFQKAGWSNAKVTSQIDRGLSLISGYKASGSDYINFHWYIADTGALAEAVTYLQGKTGLPAMTNEVGQQQNDDPQQVTNVMQKVVDLKLPYAVWFSIDINGFAGARALNNPDGSLRPNGEAFKSFIGKAF